MLKIRKAIDGKLKNNKGGFTLVELLAVMLIASLAMITIGGGVTVVKDAYYAVTMKSEADMVLSTLIIRLTDEFRFAENVTVDDEGIVSFTSKVDGKGGPLYLSDAPEPDGDRESDNIHFCSKADNKSVGTVITDATITNKAFKLRLDEYSYGGGLFTATVSVVDKNNGKVYSEQTVRIAPLN